MASTKNTSIEIEGKDAKEAVTKALEILGARREDVDILVLCEEEKGLFGLKGGKPAKVRVTLKRDIDKSKKAL